MKKTYFLIFLLVCSFAQAQIKTETLDEVIINGKRTVKESATTITKVDSVQMAESSSSTFADLLSKHSSIFVKTYGQGSTATVSFRGTAASHTQVEWNGVNINNPMLGQVDFSLIPVWFVDNTELYHGGSSMQEGSGALGGEVSMASSVSWNKKIYSALMQTAGSYGTYQTFIDIGGGSKKLQVRMRYMFEVAENDFEYLNRAIPPFDVVKQTNADYKKHGGVIDLNYNAGKGHFLSFNGWFMHSDRNMPTIMSYQGSGRQENQKDNELRLVGRWKKYWSKYKSEFTTSFTTTNIDYFMANIAGEKWFTNYDSRSVVYSFYNKYRFEYSPSQKTTYSLLANANYHAVNIFDRKTEEGYSAERVELGLSISAHHKFNPWFSGYALLREDVVDGSWTNVMPSVGAEFAPLKDKNFTVKINATRNYHQPTLNDLYWSPGGNPDLKPEEGYSGDVSADYARKMGRFVIKGNATIFASQINDWIMWQPSEFRYWTATNIKEVFSRGAELTLSGTYDWNGVKTTLSGNYSYTRITNQDPTADQARGRQLIYIPEHKGNIMLDASYRGFYIYYVWSAVSERYTTISEVSTRHTLPAYDIHNITFGKRINTKKDISFDINMKINNAFDRKYQAILWRAMPGRNYLFSVKISYK